MQLLRNRVCSYLLHTHTQNWLVLFIVCDILQKKTVRSTQKKSCGWRMDDFDYEFRSIVVKTNDTWMETVCLRHFCYHFYYQTRISYGNSMCGNRTTTEKPRKVLIYTRHCACKWSLAFLRGSIHRCISHNPVKTRFRWIQKKNTRQRENVRRSIPSLTLTEPTRFPA